MSIWADYLVTGVQYDPGTSFIINVVVRKDYGKELGPPLNLKSKRIIALLKRGITFVTATKDYENDRYIWKKGEPVIIVTKDGKDYLVINNKNSICF